MESDGRLAKHRATGKKHLAAAGLLAEQRHDLRHTCTSSLIAGWRGRRWTLEEVKELLGHADISITQRYAHLADSALDAAARETHRASAWADRSAHNQPTVPDTDPTSAGNPWAPPARVERTTFGLGKKGHPDELHELECLRGLILGLSQRGVQALAAIATGGPGAWRVVQELLVDLVRAGEAAAAEQEAVVDVTAVGRGTR